MSQINGKRRYTNTIAAVGDISYVAGAAFVLDGGSISPPARGELAEVHVTLNAGPGTQVGVRIREGAAGRIVVDYPLQAFPLRFADPDVMYQVTNPAVNLVAEVITDDATVGTTVDVELVIYRHATS